MSLGKGTSYTEFLKTISKMAYKGPAPHKLHNTHLQVMSPFHKKPLGAVDPFLNPIAIKSAKFAESVKSISQSDTAAHSSASSDSKQVTDIPFPNVLTRHMIQPITALAQGTPIGKIIGFKITSKGRKGPRSVKQSVDYGKLEAGSIANVGGVYVDYGKSFYVDKKGSTGIKVWITYGSN
ncbi:hypothetical protein RTP6_004429 [Batrachochytrium dendrobatidis]